METRGKPGITWTERQNQTSQTGSGSGSGSSGSSGSDSSGSGSSSDEKIWDASPIRDSANPEAEIGRPYTTIA